MSKTRIWLLTLCAAFVLGGCGGDTQVDPSGEDPNPPDGPDVDPPPNSNDKELGSAKLADLCKNNEECASGLCVSLGQGVNDSLCSQRCEEASDCGAASVWDCTEVDTSLNDTISVCVPKDLCLDNDSDGYGVGPGCLGPDCDDNDPDIYYGAPELCDGKDNDCNDAVDDNPIDVDNDCNTGLLGVCATGVSVCNDGVLECDTIIQPGQQREICDGLDNDCDGFVDESPLDEGGEDGNYVDGTGRACSKGGSDLCLNGLTICDPSQGIVCEGNDNLLDDTCDGIDDDCNGKIDDDVEGLNVPCQVGEGECMEYGNTVCDTDPHAPPVCDATPKNNASPEICDYKDNNCDGQIDEPFVNENGVYHRVEHCGACDLNCHDRWADNPFAHTVKPTCEVNGQNTQCGFTCREGFVDKDGSAANGCEHEINPRALYVAPANKGGSNNGFCGNYDNPCADISRAIELVDDYAAANQPRNEIIVAEGIYREGVILPNGVSIKGGYNALNWLRNVEEYRTIIVGSVNDDGDRYTVLAENITQNTELSGFTIIGEDAQNGFNSIGILIRNSNNRLTIKDNIIRAGVGGQGVSGDAGSDGANGAAGLPGLAGAEVNLSSCAGSNTRAGGQAGQTTCGGTNTSGGAGALAHCPNYGVAGATAQAGKGPNPGAPGQTAAGRGLYQNACYPHPDHISESFPSDGAAGAAGTDGGGGAGASDNDGDIDSEGMWRAASGKAGAAGDNGSGGGGGGASHGTMKCTSIDSNGRVFQNCNTTGLIGSSGGGGGAGGCSGAGASGGGGGGGSFGVYMHFSSSSASFPVLTGNTLERNLGGQGGDGGIGGRGGDGGGGGVGGPAPAQPTYCPQAGRSGGNGGRGGHGGGGGGGAGGISFDIAVIGATANTSTLKNNNDFVIDESTNTGGSGGPGGGSMGQSGQQGNAGVSGHILNL